MRQHSYPDQTSSLIVVLNDAILCDLSELNTFHKEILTAKPGEVVCIEYVSRSLNRFESQKLSFKSYMGVKISGAQIISLKRTMLELTEYFRFRILTMFHPEENPLVVAQQKEVNEHLGKTKQKNDSPEFRREEDGIPEKTEQTE